MENKLLNLGSIVKIKSIDNKVLISGYGQIRKDIDESNIFDYAGYIYPCGMVHSNQILVFNNNDVKELIFTGYEDEESNKYKKNVYLKINEYRSKIKGELNE